MLTWRQTAGSPAQCRVGSGSSIRPGETETELSVQPEQDRLPRLVDGLDLKALPIGPADAFVLSRVDGSSTAAEIASAAGMALSEVEQTLTRLTELGAVAFESSRPGTPKVARAVRSDSKEWVGSGAEGNKNSAERLGGALYDSAELDEEVDLDPDRRRAILDTFYKLDVLNHYELLGVERTADKRVLRTRYHEVVNLFHPDRYYGKKLGAFKAKLERIFQQLTEAHEVLNRSDARSEYDAYLEAEKSTQALDRELHDQEVHARELREAQARIEAEARAEVSSRASASVAASPEPQRASAPASTPAVESRRTASSIPTRTESESGRIDPIKSDPEARKRALARKLGLSSPPPPGSRSSFLPPSEPQGFAVKRAAEDLKRRYEHKMLEVKRRQASEYEVRAEDALQSGNLVGAVNALRVAVSLNPDQTEIRSRLAELERNAAGELATRYFDQARYEEREKRWGDAARSYARALTSKSNARTHERLANALLMAQGDTRRALEHARAAVLETPNEAKFRVTLALAYLAAKMRESALGEFERAASLAPSDDSIREQIKSLKRGES